jgi:protein-tyrosine phosphatase
LPGAQAAFRAPIDITAFPGLARLDALMGGVLAFRRAGRTVLSHCTAGVSRSGLVDVAYGMKAKGCSRDRALEQLRRVGL